MVSESSRVSGQLHDPILPVLKINDEFLSLLLSLYAVLLLLLFFPCCLQHVRDLSVFLIAHEFCIPLSVEEHYIYVFLRAPASVAAVSGLVRGPSHRLSAEGPSESAVAVSAFGQVCDVAILDIDQSYILIVPASVCLIVAEDVSAVRAPCEALVSV